MYSRLLKGYVPITATCKGDYDDPMLKLRIIKFKRTLQSLLKSGSRCIIVDDVSPWNSIRIKLRLSHDACLRLRELAQQRSPLLAELGILSLRFDADNESFAIVEAPNPAASGMNPGPSGSTSSDALFSFLVGGAHDTDESKPLIGTRRALTHTSAGSFADSEFSSSPKIAKRASGLRRPRGPRSSRGSRGSMAGSALSRVGSMDNPSTSQPSDNNILPADSASGKKLSVSQTYQCPPNDVPSINLPSNSSVVAQTLGQAVSLATASSDQLEPSHTSDQALLTSVAQLSDRPDCSQSDKVVPLDQITRLQSNSPKKSEDSCSVATSCHGSTHMTIKKEEKSKKPDETVTMEVNSTNLSASPISRQAESLTNTISTDGSDECSSRDDIPSRPLNIPPLLAAVAARSLSVVNGCSVSDSTASCEISTSTTTNAISASILETFEIKAVGVNVSTTTPVEPSTDPSNSKHIEDEKNEPSNDEIRSPVSKGDDDNLSSAHFEDKCNSNNLVNGRNSLNSDVETSMEVDDINTTTVNDRERDDIGTSNEENNELTSKGRSGRSSTPVVLTESAPPVIPAVGSNVNGSHEDASPSSVVPATDS